MATQAEQTIDSVLNDTSLSREQMIRKIKTLYFDARARQRAATESPMVGDDGLNNDLMAYEQALENLGIDVASIEDEGAATL
ncbi:hypothetical protein GGD81_001757 [Rhodobium orientis]|uniref:Uncharacterized protein n=1 Tax=Rhodobium orientis TaxID=34017 RepID=A0A327JXS3_9HYPH|nr:hypothetical protein [Rhodobium orientis]MBB4302721.1 hypothetical protein [Rhodobium orientis]MBK5948503.1 hypothetical protein [Rhodobium orientis]RAI29772.1 hypothetical protein CH339_01785 [Rhodobium orientis]